jgi:hypothetical protein
MPVRSALDSEEAKRRWNGRLCGNYPHAVHPMTGERDDSFPGLEQPVKVDEVGRCSGRPRRPRMRVCAYAQRNG